jgi:hypothetical protein
VGLERDAHRLVRLRAKKVRLAAVWVRCTVYSTPFTRKSWPAATVDQSVVANGLEATEFACLICFTSGDLIAKYEFLEQNKFK